MMDADLWTKLQSTDRWADLPPDEQPHAPAARAQLQEEIEAVQNAGVQSYADLLALVQDPVAPTASRTVGCRLLSLLHDHQAVPALLVALRDVQPEVRRAAAFHLPGLAGEQALEPLIATLQGDVDVEVRRTAASALGEGAYERAVDALVATLTDTGEDPSVRATAAKELGHAQKPRAGAALIAALTDPSAEVRYWAAYALGHLGDNQAVPALGQLAATDEAVVPDWGPVSTQAAWAIQVIGRRQEERAIAALLEAGKGSALDLVALVQDRTAPAATRTTAAGALVWRRHEGAVPVLGAILLDNTEDPAMRQAAARWLGRLENTLACPPLITALHHDADPAVRQEAAGALGELGGEPVVDALVATLSNGQEAPGVRAAVATALMYVGSRRVGTALVAALDDPSVAVRWWGAAALGRWGDAQALPALERLAAADDVILPGRGSLKAIAVSAIELIKARLAEAAGV